MDTSHPRRERSERAKEVKDETTHPPALPASGKGAPTTSSWVGASRRTASSAKVKLR
jgi:hypothetical protein